MPAPPTPAIALPMMNTTEFGAAPQTAEPTSKRKTVVRNTALTLQNVYSLPKRSWKAHVESR
jgi:hypothetical protein